jgi:hypothetical protein
MNSNLVDPAFWSRLQLLAVFVGALFRVSFYKF